MNERYVREWLAAMVTGRIVDYDSGTQTYRLPPEHAVAITRATGIDNVATFTQYLSCFGNVEDRVVDAFQKGGGVPYSYYPRFQQLEAEVSSQVHDARLIGSSLPLAPGLVERLRKGIEVLDVGCGSGHAVNLMAREFPASRFTGFDISQEGIAAAREEARRLGLKNVLFEVKDATSVSDKDRFELITAFDTIHDQAQPDKVLKGVFNALKPGGFFLMVDIAASSNLEENLDHPLAPTLYSVSTFHCMTVSLASGGEGLGTMWGEQVARQRLTAAGLATVEVKRVLGDIMNSYYIATKS